MTARNVATPICLDFKLVDPVVENRVRGVASRNRSHSFWKSDEYHSTIDDEQTRDSVAIAGDKLGTEPPTTWTASSQTTVTAAVVSFESAAFATNEFTSKILAEAIADGDQEVAAAANYNLLHLRAVTEEDAIARPALEELAKSGDEFTLRWLVLPAHPAIPASRQPQVAQTMRRIRERLKDSPEPPEKQVRAWLLRAAVSDITCNPLESALDRFRRAWVAQHLNNAAVKKELDALASTAPTEAGIFGPGLVRVRARDYAASVWPLRSPRQSHLAKPAARARQARRNHDQPI